MASLDATDIINLPVNPAIGGNPNQPNIVLHRNEKISENTLEQISKQREEELKQISSGPQQALQMQNNIDQSTINKLVSGIQQASANGLTSLPSRDIPQMTSQITQDQQIKPNYVPTPPSQYIENEETRNEIIEANMRKQNKADSLDVMYDELQIPILLALLFFIFQLPLFRGYLFKFLPSLFNKDGNPNLSGYVMNSLLFALFYYVIKKTLTYLTTI